MVRNKISYTFLMHIMSYNLPLSHKVQFDRLLNQLVRLHPSFMTLLLNDYRLKNLFDYFYLFLAIYLEPLYHKPLFLVKNTWFDNNYQTTYFVYVVILDSTMDFNLLLCMCQVKTNKYHFMIKRQIRPRSGVQGCPVVD